MADHQFNIKLGVKVEKGDSEKQLENLKKSLEEKKISLKLDVSKATEELTKFKDSLKDINTKLNDAFKLNNGALDNLKNLKTVLEEINKLSKKTQIKITNSNDVDTITKNLETQKQKYAELIKLKQNLIKQRAGTTDTSAIDSLNKQIQLVEQEANKCKTAISKMTEIKLSTDMTKSMVSQFQSTRDQLKNLKADIENTLRSSNLTDKQKTDLKDMLNTVNQLNKNKVDLTSDKAETKVRKLTNKLSELNTRYKDIKLDIKVNDNIRSANKSVDDLLNKLKTAQNSKTGTNSFINKSELEKIIQDVEKFKNDISNINLKGNVETELAKILANIDNCENKFKELQNSAKLSMEIKGDVNSQTEKIDTMLNKLKEMKQWKIGSNAYIDESKINEAISKLEQYKNELKNLDVNDEKVASEFETIKSKINETTQEIKEFQNQAKQGMKIDSNNASIDSLKNKITQLKNEEKLTTEQAEQLKQKLNQISQMDVGKQANAIKHFRNELKQATDETARLQTGVKKTNTFFSNLYSTMSTFSLGNIISMQITKAIYGISDTIRELDKAFVGLTKVAPDSFHGTAEELENVRQKAVEVGQDVARSATDIINSTASALQLGINDMDKAMEYAKNVNIYANVSDQSEEIADKHIKSIMSAYGGVNESLDVMSNKVKGAGDNYSRLNDFMDEANYVGNNFALTSADVGEALMRSASAFKSNGTEMSESIGLIVGAQETIQDSSKVGNSFKTMVNRLNGVTYSMKEGDIIANKTAQAFEKLAGIKIVDWDTNKVKDAYTIFSQLADKWDDMNDVQRNGIADALGGAHHLNTLQALMNNWDTVVQYQEIASSYVQKCA